MIEVTQGRLVDQPVAALLLSANNQLNAGSGWSLECERLCGPGYCAECREVAAAAGREGLPRGSAVVTGGGKLAQGGRRRWILQAITIRYEPDGTRVKASPRIVYRAVRTALEKAELFRIESVATYLMVQKADYRNGTADEMAEALFRALVDHAAVASSVKRIVVCAADAAEEARARQAHVRARQAR